MGPPGPPRCQTRVRAWRGPDAGLAVGRDALFLVRPVRLAGPPAAGAGGGGGAGGTGVGADRGLRGGPEVLW